MDFLFYFIALSDFPPRPRSLNYNCFIIIYRWSTSSNFIILLKTYFVASGSFHFPMNFRFSSSIYTKKKNLGFDWGCFNTIDHLGKNWHFNNIHSAFGSRNMIHLFVYLGLLSFLSMMFYGFQCTVIAHVCQIYL